MAIGIPLASRKVQSFSIVGGEPAKSIRSFPFFTAQLTSPATVLTISFSLRLALPWSHRATSSRNGVQQLPSSQTSTDVFCWTLDLIVPSQVELSSFCSFGLPLLLPMLPSLLDVANRRHVRVRDCGKKHALCCHCCCVFGAAAGEYREAVF